MPDELYCYPGSNVLKNKMDKYDWVGELRKQPGKEYKALVEREAILGSKVDFPHKIDDLLEKHFGVSGTEKRKKCCNEIIHMLLGHLAMRVLLSLLGNEMKY